ncbi:MAG: NAD-dependent epimerase/dehydratase family protein, partial [Bacteroidota bacterium]
MIVVTGAAGFIGSCMIQELNRHNFNRIVAVDDFGREDKQPNLGNKRIEHRIDRNRFFDWLDGHHEETEFIFHLGARTDTTEINRALLWQLNT